MSSAAMSPGTRAGAVVKSGYVWATAIAWVAAFLVGLGACGGSAIGLDAGTGPHSCTDCARAFACCQAVLASQGNTTSVCSLSEPQCQGLQINDQREYIFNCDSYLLGVTLDAAACQ